MEINQLRYFCAAAEMRSFTAGARRERVAQPTLSQQIMKLEQELGTKLFERLQHQVRLTESGETFFRSAKSILAKISESRQEIQASAKEPQRSITVGATPVIAIHLLSPAIRELKRRDASIKVRVVEDLPWHLMPALSEGIIHLALVGLPVAGREFRSGKILTQSLVVALPEAHPLAMRKRIRLVELRNDSFILMNQRFTFRDQVLQMLRAARIEPDVMFEGSSIANIVAMVATGAGVSLVPELVAAKGQGCKFIPLIDSHAGFDLGWAMLKNRAPSPEQRTIIAALKTVAQQQMCGGRAGLRLPVRLS